MTYQDVIFLKFCPLFSFLPAATGSTEIFLGIMLITMTASSVSEF